MTEQEMKASAMVACGEFVCGPTIYVSQTLLAQRGEAYVRELVRHLLNLPARSPQENPHG